MAQAGPSRHRRVVARWRGGALWLPVLVLLLPGCSPPPRPDVLVVVNGESRLSSAIGSYYRMRRGVPESNLLTLSVPVDDPLLRSPDHETISRARFESEIRDPIERFLEERGLVDSITILVLTKGVPLRVAGRPGAISLRDADLASVDAELALLFSGLDGRAGVEGMVNPYFDSDVPFARFRSERPDSPLRYLVARLTGYQEPIDPSSGVPIDVKRLIDGALALGSPGTFVVDEDPDQPAGLQPGNLDMLNPAALALRALGVDVLHDQGALFVSDVEDIVGYASWGSNDIHDPGPPYYGAIGGKRFPGRFAARSIALEIVSTNARTFTHPPAYGQSLIADLVRVGVAGAAGSVYEPNLAGVARADVLLRNYARGVPAGEAYARSIPYLGWMNVWVGDPLMSLPRTLREPADLDGDGVANAADNCPRTPNPAQRDANRDGFGNRCDADVDDDGRVTTSWIAADPARSTPCPEDPDLESFCRAMELGLFVPELDLNTDGAVDALDLSLAVDRLFFAPGR